MKFVIIRHGQTVSNENGTFTGRTDAQLSSIGKNQAQLLCDYLFKTYSFSKIFTSPLKRAVDTITPLCSQLKISPVKEQSFIEIDGGDFEGLTSKELLERFPKEFGLWQTDVGKSKCPNGEDFNDVTKRAVGKILELAQSTDDLGETILISTHAGVVRAITCYFSGIPVKDLASIPWAPNASITEIIFDGKNFSFGKIRQDDYLLGQVSYLSKGF